MNRAILGGIVRKTEHLVTEKGLSRFRFTLEERRGDRAGYHKGVAWGGLADRAHAVLKDGVITVLVCRWQTRRWENRSRQTVYTTEFVVERFFPTTPEGRLDAEDQEALLTVFRETLEQTVEEPEDTQTQEV